MKKLILLPLLLCAVSAFAMDGAEIKRAMTDEMARTKKQLFLKGAQKPHFIGFFVLDSQVNNMASTMGALDYSVQNSWKNILVDMRVGDDKLDNTGFGEAGVTMSGTADGYDSLRKDIWLTADNAYKDALEQYSQKKGFLQRKNIKEYYPDFSKADKINISEKKNTEVFDVTKYEDIVKKLSAAGRDYKEFISFGARLYFTSQEKYYVNSEGSYYFADGVYLTMSITATLQNDEGITIEKEFRKNYASLTDVPSAEELEKQAQKFAKDAASFKHAKKADSFIGPILFSKGAAADILSWLFVSNIENTKPFLSADSDNDWNSGSFAERKGLRVISSNIDVTDDPAAQKYNGVTLSGYHLADDEGVKSEKVILTKDGKLVDLLTARSLIKGQKKSNGHGSLGSGWWNRSIRAKASNVFFIPKETVAANKLNARLIEECKKLELDYCYRVDDFRSKTAYKVSVKDGKEEPVYGMDYSGITLRSLRDLIAAGDDIKPYNTESTAIISPSLIIAEIEITPSQQKPDQKPYVAKPN